MQILSHCLSLQFSSLLQRPPALWSKCRRHSCWSRLHWSCTLWACSPWWSSCRCSPRLLLLCMWLRWWSWADNATTLGALGYNDGLCSWCHFSSGRTCSGMLSCRTCSTTSFCLPHLVWRSWRHWPGAIHRFAGCRTAAAGFLWMISFSLSFTGWRCRGRRGGLHLVSSFAHWRRWRMGSFAFLGWRANLLSRGWSVTAFVVMMSVLLSLLFCSLLLLFSWPGCFLFLHVAISPRYRL